MNKALLLIGFGNLGVIQNDFQNKFPGYRIAAAKTAADGLKSLDAHKVFVQPLFLLPGFAYEKLCREAVSHEGAVTIGKPLLHNEKSAEALADVFVKQYDDFPALFVGHGSKHPTGDLYAVLAEALRGKCKHPMFVGLLDGKPDFNAAANWIAQNQIKQLRLVPLMMSAGKHMHNEIIGDSAQTWRTKLENIGTEIYPIHQGLLDYQRVKDIILSEVL